MFYWVHQLNLIRSVKFQRQVCGAHTHTYIQTYNNIRPWALIWLYTHTCMYAYVYVYTYLREYTYYIYIHIIMYIYIYIYIYTYTYIYTYIHIHIYICVCIHILIHTYVCIMFAPVHIRTDPHTYASQKSSPYVLRCVLFHTLSRFCARAQTHTLARAHTHDHALSLFHLFLRERQGDSTEIQSWGSAVGVNIPYQYFPEHEKCPKSPLSMIVVIAHWPAQCQLAHRTAVVESM